MVSGGVDGVDGLLVVVHMHPSPKNVSDNSHMKLENWLSVAFVVPNVTVPAVWLLVMAVAHC